MPVAINKTKQKKKLIKFNKNILQFIFELMAEEYKKKI